MKTRKIVFWHGKDPSLIKKLSPICLITDENDFYYDGTLEDFEKVFPKFIVMDDFLCVTQHNSFSQR